MQIYNNFDTLHCVKISCVVTYSLDICWGVSLPCNSAAIQLVFSFSFCLFFGCFSVDAQDMWVYWVTKRAHMFPLGLVYVPAVGPVQSSFLDHNTRASMSPDVKYMHISTDLPVYSAEELKWQEESNFMVPYLQNSVWL